MIVETVDIRIRPGQQDAFEEALARGLQVIARAEGVQGWRVLKGVESPERYLLQITWNRIEDHTEGFRGGPLFVEWRGIVGSFFAAPPQMEHFTACQEGRP